MFYLVGDTRERVFEGYKSYEFPLKYSCEGRYFIKGTVNPRSWHSFDDAILLDTFVRSRLGSGS